MAYMYQPYRYSRRTTVQSWPLLAYYDFPSSSSSADELRRLIRSKENGTTKDAELEKRLCALDSIRQEYPCTLVLQNFYKKKRDSAKWVSAPFYTKSRGQGYKLCLVVYPNGYGEGHRSHVSVYLHLMWGEFDYLLKWPFKGDFTVEAVSSGTSYMRGKHEATISFGDRRTDNESQQRVESGEMNPVGSGVASFLSHRNIDRYIADDCLSFRVSGKEASDSDSDSGSDSDF